MLLERFSPEQISGKLTRMTNPDLRDAYACRETIYSAIYALPVGKLSKDRSTACGKGNPLASPAVGKWNGATRFMPWSALPCALLR